MLRDWRLMSHHEQPKFTKHQEQNFGSHTSHITTEQLTNVQNITNLCWQFSGAEKY